MRLILCWLGIWIFCVGLFAQNTKDNSSYLFDEFQDCLIVYTVSYILLTLPSKREEVISVVVGTRKKKQTLTIRQR